MKRHIYHYNATLNHKWGERSPLVVNGIVLLQKKIVDAESMSLLENLIAQRAGVHINNWYTTFNSLSYHGTEEE